MARDIVKRVRSELHPDKRQRMISDVVRRGLKRHVPTSGFAVTRKRVRSEITPRKRHRVVSRELKRARPPVDLAYYGGDRKRRPVTGRFRPTPSIRATTVQFRLL